MISIINNNPFRVLGVWTNAKQVDIVRNISKMKAYLNVGRSVEFSADLSAVLPPLNRTLQLAQEAQAAINLPNDKIRYALFWPCCVDPLDVAGLNNLAAGDCDKARSIFIKKDSYSALINRAVLSLIQSDYSSAVVAFSSLIHDFSYRGQFCAAICGETFQISEDDLSHILIDELLKEVKASTLLQLVVNEADKAYVSKKAVEEPISLISHEIATAKSVTATDAQGSLRAGRALMKNTRTALATLRSIAGAGSAEYQSSADNLAKQILQCGINYYNNSDDDNNIDNGLELQEYALSIAVGKMTKDRCQKNVEILREKKERRAYEKDLAAIAVELKSFQATAPSIARARTLVNNCKPHLAVIRQNLGSQDEFYLKISSAVANNALGMLIDVVNRAQNSAVIAMNIANGTLATTLDSAVNAMAIIGQLDMTAQERSHFNTNNNTLSNLKSTLDSAMRQTRSTYSSSSSSSSGCYIATMVYGDYDEPQVMILREFRDKVLRNSTLGRLFIRFYYRYSPTWVEHLKDKKRINALIRSILDKFINIYKHE